MTRCARRIACRAPRWSAWGCTASWRPPPGGIKAGRPEARVAYVMTDSAALPLAYSRLVQALREQGLLDVTVTAGQAFGGDLEAVNLYSALVTAAVAGKADIIIAGQGPGNVGTGTALGFGGVEQAMLLNAAAALEGLPIAVPRISFADPRARHLGLSHHTLTVLGRLTLAPAILPLPAVAPEHADRLLAQIEQHGLSRHQLRTADGLPGIASAGSTASRCQHGPRLRGRPRLLPGRRRRGARGGGNAHRRIQTQRVLVSSEQ